MDNDKAIWIKINQTNVEYSVGAYVHEEDNGMYSCYVPVFDIYYSAPSRQIAEERIDKVVKSFFNFWVVDQGF